MGTNPNVCEISQFYFCTNFNIDVGVGFINMVKEAWMLSVESKGGMKHISPTYLSPTY